MKRSEMLVSMQKFYVIRHVMLENKYITLDQFMKELLDYQESLGMLPPKITILPDSYNRAEGSYGFEVHEWEEEIDVIEKK